MIDLKKETFEKKLLGEACWIELAQELGMTEPVRVRIDYPTRSQTVELRRLSTLWESGSASPDTRHWIDYYFRVTVKEVEGFTIEGKPTRLLSEKGLATVLSSEDSELDIVAVLHEYGLLQAVCGLIKQRLEFTEVDKKKLQLRQNSSSKENLIQSDSKGETYSMVGTLSTVMDEKI